MEDMEMDLGKIDRKTEIWNQYGACLERKGQMEEITTI